MTVHSVRMPIGFSRSKTMGRPISVKAHLKKSIVEVKTEDNYLAHALIIAISRLNDDSKYESYRKSWNIRSAVQNVFETTGIDLSNYAGIPEFVRFQEYLHEYQIVVYRGLSCDSIMFEGRVESSKRINFLYDDVGRYYHVITKITGAMATRYVCKTCNKGCERHVTHICDQTYGDCMSVPPCEFPGLPIPCVSCNRNFSSHTCFDEHKTNKLRGKTVCE